MRLGSKLVFAAVVDANNPLGMESRAPEFIRTLFNPGLYFQVPQEKTPAFIDRCEIVRDLFVGIASSESIYVVPIADLDTVTP
jgi:hypothetical protein